jgi:hypothetical protein
MNSQYYTPYVRYNHSGGKSLSLHIIIVITELRTLRPCLLRVLLEHSVAIPSILRDLFEKARYQGRAPIPSEGYLDLYGYIIRALLLPCGCDG